MIVVGGTYLEEVVEPRTREWAGSGLRAAAALARRADPPTLYTAIDGVGDSGSASPEGSLEEVQLTAAALGVRIAEASVGRTERVGFRYVTPISAPSVNGPNSRVRDSIVVYEPSETVLVFGMVEAAAAGAMEVTAGTVVLDPQRPRDSKPLELSGISADRIVIVANVSEVRGLGRSPVLRTAAETVLKENENIWGVVTKRGASGCLVSQGGGEETVHDVVGAHPTRRVWPIGSGDVFSAGLAHALDTGVDLLEAARVASACAAHWCSTQVHAVPKSILDGEGGELPKPMQPAACRVYLAGPFFSIGERWLVETVRDELLSLGVEVWSPVHEVGPGGLEVAEKDLKGLLDCDAVIALLDHSDPGTVFEVGWAVRHHMPVVGYTTVPDVEGTKMLAGTAVEMHDDLSTACYRAAWAGMGLKTRPGWMRR